MKIVSLENSNVNTNTLNIKLNGTMTVAELFRNADVARFAAGAAIDSIEAIDNAPASLLKRNGDTRGLENFQLTDDSVIELNAFAENKEVTGPVKGKVKVSLGGLGAQYTVNINCGETTVAQTLTDKLATALDRSRSELMNMKISINDMEGTTASVLHDGDVVILQGRKAGDHGAGDTHYISVFDEDDATADFAVEGDETLQEFVCHKLCAGIFEEADVSCVLENVALVDDACLGDMSDNMRKVIFDAPAKNYNKIEVTLPFAAGPGEDVEDDEDAYSIAVTDAAGVTKTFANPEDSEETVAEFLERIGADEDDLYELDDQIMDNINSTAIADAVLDSDLALYGSMKLRNFVFPSEAPQEFTAEGVSEGTSQEFSAEGVEEIPACGKVILTRGNTERMEMLIKEGETTLDDLLFSDKVLNKWAMTRGQMGTMSIYVNDVQVYKTDITLHIGDTVNITAPKCGNHGAK